jgi:peptidoglycan hydrolase-like protein with peptidoglycan-binding domain
MKWLSIAASLALACALLSGASPAPARARQASSSPPSATLSSGTTSHPKRKKGHTRTEPKQKAPTPERISEIQSALSRGGYYQGDPNGKWDSSTVTAVQKFQSANGIEANGKLDAPTLQKLGLGSDIAGVSAPKPITPPSSDPPHPAIAPPTSQLSAPASGAATASNIGTAPTSDVKLPQK